MEKKSSLIKDEIDISYFFRLIKKNKILIISVAVICALLAYTYQNYQPRELQVQFKIIPAPLILFNKKVYYDSNINSNSHDLVKVIYDTSNNSLITNLLSLDYLEEFVSQDKKIDNFNLNIQIFG